MIENWTIEHREEAPPILLLTIHAAPAIRLADSEFDSTVWSADQEFLGHPIRTDAPLEYDEDPPPQASLLIDVPDQLLADMLVKLEVHTPLTVTFTDRWAIPVGLRQSYVVTDSVDAGGMVIFGIRQAALQYEAHERAQQPLWTGVHARPHKRRTMAAHPQPGRRQRATGGSASQIAGRSKGPRLSTALGPGVGGRVAPECTVEGTLRGPRFLNRDARRSPRTLGRGCRD